MDIRTKLIFAFVATTLASMLVLGAAFYNASAGILQSIAVRQLQSLVAARQQDLKIVADGWFDQVRLISSRTKLRDSLEQYVERPSDELRNTMQGILQQADIPNWHQAYQSQGMIPVPWLEPSVEETLDKIAENGGKTALMVPVGFVCDHIEILYDIDIAFKEYATGRGIELYRTESLNTSPLFIEALAGVVWEHLV